MRIALRSWIPWLVSLRTEVGDRNEEVLLVSGVHLTGIGLLREYHRRYIIYTQL